MQTLGMEKNEELGGTVSHVSSQKSLIKMRYLGQTLEQVPVELLGPSEIDAFDSVNVPQVSLSHRPQDPMKTEESASQLFQAL